MAGIVLAALGLALAAEPEPPEREAPPPAPLGHPGCGSGRLLYYERMRSLDIEDASAVIALSLGAVDAEEFATLHEESLHACLWEVPRCGPGARLLRLERRVADREVDPDPETALGAAAIGRIRGAEDVGTVVERVAAPVTDRVTTLEDEEIVELLVAGENPEGEECEAADGE